MHNDTQAGLPHRREAAQGAQCEGRGQSSVMAGVGGLHALRSKSVERYAHY
jgi:hypothetical protein